MKVRWLIPALALLALSAFAPAASATTLCETPLKAECPFGERYPVPQKIQAALVPKTVFKMVMGVTVECNESKVTAETLRNEVALITGLGNWTLSHNGGECAIVGGGKCTTMEVKPIPTEVWLLSAGGNGWLKFPKTFTVESVCAGVKCIYSHTEAEMEFKGGGPGEAQINVNGLKLEKAAGSNVFCAVSATVTAEYLISEPAKALWITKSP